LNVLSEIQPRIAERADQLSREFASARPFQHVIIDDLLDSHFCQEWMREFPAFDAARALNERGEPTRENLDGQGVGLPCGFQLSP